MYKQNKKLVDDARNTAGKQGQEDLERAKEEVAKNDAAVTGAATAKLDKAREGAGKLREGASAKLTAGREVVAKAGQGVTDRINNFRGKNTKGEDPGDADTADESVTCGVVTWFMRSRWPSSLP